MKIHRIDPRIYSGIHCPFTGVTIDFEVIESGDQLIPEGSIVVGVIDCRGDTPESPETRSDWFDTRWRDLFEEAVESGQGVDCEALIKAFDFPDGLAIKLAYPESAPVETFIVVRSSAWNEGYLLYADAQETPARPFG
ncbi:hypothetical protein [Marinobacterium sp. BA1]|uniref:hypothetical protein n=1 Tax=Marinobacterium sp. BA1 TaxID=3138931 RepID=UPI0032E70005